MSVHTSLMAYMGFSVTKAKIKPSHRDVIANDLLKDLSTNFKESDFN